MGRALVTGASCGIGEAIARELAVRGWALVLVSRRVDRLETLAAELMARHDVMVEVLGADLADPGQLRVVEERLADSRRPVTLLVNNAGTGSTGPFSEMPVDGEGDTVLVNALALMRLCHAALLAMRPRGDGAILNLASVAGLMPLFPGSATYGATKAFVCSLSESLALESRPYGVRVTALCPGYVRTEMTAHIKLPGIAWTSMDRVVRDA